MKKSVIYIVAACTLMATACNLDRLPLTGPSSGSFPNSEEEALSGILAAYKSMANMDVKSTTLPRIMDCTSDIGAYRLNSGNANQEAVMKSNMALDNALTTKVYSYVYKVLGRVHLVLDNLDNLKGKVPDETIEQLRIECLLLRDWHLDLGCQFYGDIPFIDHCLTLDDNQYPRVKREEVTRRILFDDLKDEKIDLLPVQWPFAVYGTTRIGRAAAYAIKAKIALNWGYFELAAQCARKSLDLCDGVYELQKLDLTHYATADDGEPDPSPLFGYAGQSSKEWLWASQYNRLIAENFNGGAYYMFPRPVGGCSWHGPNQHFIDTFQCTDGKAITESPLYDWKHPYENRDPRLDLFCIRNNSRVLGLEYSNDVRVTQIKDYTTGKMTVNSEATGNKSEYGANGTKGPGGYLWRKYVDKDYVGRVTGSSMEDDLNGGLLRLAEIYLIDAEANIEWDGGDLSRAAQDINTVRARVGMPPVQDGTRAGLRSALRYERKVEMACEGFRWFDVRRWKDKNGRGVAEKAVNGRMYGPPFSNTSNKDEFAFVPNGKPIIDEDWIVTYDGVTTWDGSPFNLRTCMDMIFDPAKDYLWPIPKDEIDSNFAITYNNPGYPQPVRNEGDTPATGTDAAETTE